MSTPDRVILFAQSQYSRVHLESQHVIIVLREGNILEIKAFAVGRRADPVAWELRGMPSADTDSRLLTEMNRSGMCLRRWRVAC
jgi:hypothetical protein